ncbi:MAG: GntR family transcriptional regulator [Gracilibacteraceae bacterium]|jgi:DNA-binding GntR family transcriptional regulator|nr:GntR family transcriptional regulator [Gracilibacteraceae bacterium]
MSDVLRSETVSDQVYHILRQKIINGSLKAGEPLVTSQLAETLNTSRTPLREALKRLEEAGWVERKTNGVMTVSDMSVMELREIYSVRAVLEGLMTYEATPIITDAELDKIEEKLQQYDAIRESQVLAIVTIGEEIHSQITKVAGNSTCQHLLEQILHKLNRYRTYSVSVSGRYKQVLTEHKEILRCMRARDAEAAEKAMRKHLLNASVAGERGIRKKLSDPAEKA